MRYYRSCFHCGMNQANDKVLPSGISVFSPTGVTVVCQIMSRQFSQNAGYAGNSYTCNATQAFDISACLNRESFANQHFFNVEEVIWLTLSPIGRWAGDSFKRLKNCLEIYRVVDQQRRRFLEKTVAAG